MRGVANLCHCSENIRRGEKRKMCKNRLEHYASQPTITFNINKITKYERPAAECPRTLLYFKSEPRPLTTRFIF